MDFDYVYDALEKHRVLIACTVTSVVGLYIFKRLVVNGRKCESKAKLRNKTVLITGANTGIGKVTALDLARRGARVLLACRNISKAENAAAEIRKSTGNTDVEVYELDLASLKSVRKCAEEVISRESRLDILINNAGVMFTPYWKTEDGFEMQIGVNHFGHFLLTNLLLDLLKKSAPSRVVVVSSGAHTSGVINFDDINSEKGFSSFKAYAQSKLANVLFCRELSKRLKGTGVMTNVLHPGVINTELSRYLINESGVLVGNLTTSGLSIENTSEIIGVFHSSRKYPSSSDCLVGTLLRVVNFFVQPIFMKTPVQGAQTTIHVAVSEELENVSGKYFSECAVKTPSKLAQDDELASKLWTFSEKQVGLAN